MGYVHTILPFAKQLLTQVRFRSAFSTENINGVYIPSALLILGTFLVKQEWLPFAVAIAAVLGGVKLVGGSSTWR